MRNKNKRNDNYIYLQLEYLNANEVFKSQLNNVLNLKIIFYGQSQFRID